jgi:hypothetical protein
MYSYDFLVLSKQVLYVLKVLPEDNQVLFDLLRIIFAYYDALDEFGDLDHVILLHAQASYLWGPNA